MTDFDKEFESQLNLIPLEKRGKGYVVFHGEADPDSRAKFQTETQGVLARIEYAKRLAVAIDAVKNFLKREGKTQRWLAQEMYMTEQQVGQILKPGRILEGETLTRLIMATGVDLFACMAEKGASIEKNQFYSELGHPIKYTSVQIAKQLVNPKAIQQGNNHLNETLKHDLSIHETTIEKHAYSLDQELDYA